MKSVIHLVSQIIHLVDQPQWFIWFVSSLCGLENMYISAPKWGFVDLTMKMEALRPSETFVTNCLTLRHNSEYLN